MRTNAQPPRPARARQRFAPLVAVRLPTFLCHSPPVELLDEPGAPFSEAEHFLPAPLECSLGLCHVLIGVPLLGGVLEVAGSLQLRREPGQLFMKLARAVHHASLLSLAGSWVARVVGAGSRLSGSERAISIFVSLTCS